MNDLYGNQAISENVNQNIPSFLRRP